jgi:mono/diheme cytochrome c family protein
MKKYIILAILLIPSIALAGGYGINHGFYNNQTIIKERQVEFNGDTFLGLDGYYSHGQALKAKYDAIEAQEEREHLKAVKEQNEILRKMLEELLKRQGGGGQPNPEEPQTPTPPPANNNLSGLDADVYALFKEKCSKCHGDARADGGLKMVSNDTLAEDIAGFTPKAFARRTLIEQRTEATHLNGDARMPKGSPPLDQEQVDLIKNWVIEKSKTEIYEND